MNRPHAAALAIVALATRGLPSGPVRDRYRRELSAELWGMSWPRQLLHALSTLAAAPALRRVLVEAGSIPFPHTRMWCLLHTHHTWHLEVTDDGGRYRRCRACGIDDDRVGRATTINTSIQIPL